MKVLLYFEGQDALAKSGIGRALQHQMKALSSQGVEYTTNPWAEDYDILHINTWGMNSDAIIHHAKKMGKKVIYHAHSTMEDFRNSFTFSNVIAPFVKIRLVDLYKQADAIITPTPYSKSLLEGYGLRQKIYVISNGIDLNRYAYDEQKIQLYRDYFHLQANQKVVMGVGLLFKRKGILDFIAVARQLPQYTFIWFGDISKLIIPPEITLAIQEAPSNCIFPGYVKGSLIEGAYHDADCFFFPSYEETEGIVVLEALASKQSLLLRDIACYNPWLKNGENAYLANNNDEFIEKLQGIIEKKLPNLSKQGYLVAKERRIEEVGKQLKAVYEEVLNQ
ncbi:MULTISPECIES: glycosyltransferase [Terrabacteria group]|uniref:glycosyltransferase n=1 Tax=Bacillati TaxID=1783272 RepID=UPI001939A68B|nr:MULTISPECIES: glycosyltransferase [Terrabacteria group]MBW9212322.1 glycosyltransferase [Trueperella sp. zg.1013]QRG86141.1 glycosyltransferase [Bulleidia sp. zg-1006]